VTKPNPNFSPGARDEMAITSSKLSLAERIRLKVAMPILLFAFLIVPNEIMETMNEQAVVSQDEVAGGAE